MKYILFILLTTSASAQTLPKTVFALTEVMFHDVVNPPAAARFYAYAMLAGAEVAGLQPTLSKAARKIPIAPHPQAPIDTSLACLYAILETGKLMIPSGYLLEEKQAELLRSHRASPELTSNSISFARLVSATIVNFSRQDGYFQLSTFSRYRPQTTAGFWQPTPPEYFAAVEPHWHRIRPFFLDSASQFVPIPAVSYSTSDTSRFMQLAKEVYQTGSQLSAEQQLIAAYWDCNPFAVQSQGHMSIGLKRISPGGHWMSITSIATDNPKLHFSNRLLIHTIVALTLHDAFISCWQEKFRSQRVRPESFINKYLDPRWKPLIQTPPFPEYTSGHSVISSAVAEVLSQYVGDNISFIDTTETYIGLPTRQFSSFKAAAAEACISRLYGGIHFRDGIENGAIQGRAIAAHILSALGPLKPLP